MSHIWQLIVTHTKRTYIPILYSPFIFVNSKIRISLVLNFIMAAKWLIQMALEMQVILLILILLILLHFTCNFLGSKANYMLLGYIGGINYKTSSCWNCIPAVKLHLLDKLIQVSITSVDFHIRSIDDHVSPTNN